MKFIIYTTSSYLNYFLVIGVLLTQPSCKKFIAVDPPTTSTNSANVYGTDATAASVLTGIYSEISSLTKNLDNGFSGVSLYAGLYTDELRLYDVNQATLLSYYRNDLARDIPNTFWGAYYTEIFNLNSAIEGLDASTSLTHSVRTQLLGEAKFLRAFCYFYLTNIYGEVPLVLSTNYKKTQSLPRSTLSALYSQMIVDLAEASEGLSEKYMKADALTSYVTGSEERVRPTKWSANALLSRVYLYKGEYENAEVAASSVVNATNLFQLTDVNSTFLKNSTEAVWQLQPVGIFTQSNTGDGAYFVLPQSGPSSAHPVYLSNNIVNSFESNDLRRQNWIDSVKPESTAYYYSNKYKIGAEDAPTSEYLMVLRLSEQYLIRAEARAMLNNLTGSKEDLNVVRDRAGLNPTTASNQSDLINAIMHERQVELFTEWGHRWFDLKRTGKLDEVMNTVSVDKGGSWGSFKAVFPIPQTDINLNGELTQNQGY